MIRFYEILMTVIKLGLLYNNLHNDIKKYLTSFIEKLTNSADQFDIKMYLHGEGEHNYPYYSGYVQDMSILFEEWTTKRF